MQFPKPDTRPDFAALEKEVADFWVREDIPARYLARNKRSKERFSFLDGPITANNPMGVHHAWGRTLKDLYQRYQTMRGKRQRYQNGFDCQGLWVEVEVERELGLRTKRDIENLVPGDREASIAKFVELCKERVRRYAGIITEQSKRLGYWMDWDHSYYTMADHNNYAIWRFLKTCHERGWLYKGRDSVPWCPRCGTAISQHEILSEEYHELAHTAVYLALPLEGRDESLLVWTTTPWTLPANIFVAVHPELKYALIESKGKKFWVVHSPRLKAVLGEGELIRKAAGRELVGLRYRGPFDDLPVYSEARRHDDFHRVLAAPDLVSEKEGTGLVHIAPSAGGEDFRLATVEHKLPELVIPTVNEEGDYLDGFGELAGKNAQKNPDLVLDRLEEFLFRKEDHTHRYPVCWRCKTELIWRVVDEWYIAMDRSDPTDDNRKRTFREQMMDVAREINWIPAWGLERELDWLRNMHDWMISKKRYWGLALPIYPCECGEVTVIGSRAELKEKAAKGWGDFEGHSPHRPWVDGVKITCPQCGQAVSRIADVGNPWLDAGIVSFSTLFPPEQLGRDGNLEGSDGDFRLDEEYFAEWFPADFVTEAFPGQFKNWFYALIAMSTGLRKQAPYRNLLGHALVRDEHGEEMHKSKGNAIEFKEAAERMGTDAMRWLFASQNPELNVNFGYGPAEEVRRRAFLLLWNSYNFFLTYVSPDFDPASPRSSEHVLDRWLHARVGKTTELVGRGLENYETPQATKAIEDLIGDLSTWYIRRSRSRMSASATPDDRRVAERELYDALVVISKLLAPITPHLAESLYRGLVIPAFPDAEPSVHLTDFPLPEAVPSDLSEVLEQMETVRKVASAGLAARAEAGIRIRQPLAAVEVSGAAKLPEKYEALLRDELNIREVRYHANQGELSVSLDTVLTPELLREGLYRELVRTIQARRKEEGLAVGETVVLRLGTDDPELEEMIRERTDDLLRDVRAGRLKTAGPADREVAISDRQVRVGLERTTG